MGSSCKQIVFVFPYWSMLLVHCGFAFPYKAMFKILTRNFLVVFICVELANCEELSVSVSVQFYSEDTSEENHNTPDDFLIYLFMLSLWKMSSAS